MQKDKEPTPKKYSYTDTLGGISVRDDILAKCGRSNHYQLKVITHIPVSGEDFTIKIVHGEHGNSWGYWVSLSDRNGEWGSGAQQRAESIFQEHGAPILFNRPHNAEHNYSVNQDAARQHAREILRYKKPLSKGQ